MLNIIFSFAQYERDMIWERTQEGKMAKRAKDPNYKEGRKALEIPAEFAEYRRRADAGEITVVVACNLLGISRSTWYKWNKMEVASNG
jgi:DNA invertase Pin-like site-specific DNA recombinase